MNTHLTDPGLVQLIVVTALTASFSAAFFTLFLHRRKPRCPWHGTLLYSHTYPVNNTTAVVHYCEHKDCGGMFFKNKKDYLDFERNAYRAGKGEVVHRPSLVKPTNRGT